MQTNFEIGNQASSELAFQQNRVLRNTYMLLALSMLPTIMGAMMVVHMKFNIMNVIKLNGLQLFIGISIFIK